MGYVMLVAWIVQAVVGVMLLWGWARHARGVGAPAVFTHAGVMVICLALWVVFVLTGTPLWAWLAVGALAVGIPFGETLMVRRARRLRGATRPGLRDYAASIGDVVSRRMPPAVSFHALFSAVVFFGSLGVAIGASVAAGNGG